MEIKLDTATSLPDDAADACLVGRAWFPGAIPGPSLVVIERDELVDITREYPTCAQLLEAKKPAEAARAAAKRGRRLGRFVDILSNSAIHRRDPAKPHLIAPCDLQALKACGVTFVSSMLERVIEERTKGEPGAADAVRRTLVDAIGVDLSAVRPGSPEAARVKELLIERSMWSQYLEVGIGPDAEVFTKSQPMSAVGTGAEVGLHPGSVWNNPEPEIVLAVNARGETVGAALGNDVNLRDFEGRSALLLGKAKDNNGSCAIGPLIRLFDENFSIDDVRQADVHLEIAGDDRFTLEATSSMAKISRDPLDLVGHAIGTTHQYPDGLMLFLGTMFAPTQDRDRPGAGFTHKRGDLVTISTPKLGALVNRVSTSDAVPPWTFGVLALIQNLRARGLL
ncbi:MAG TPA: fumarylacetoacetate hydrolase family protein [Dongiaceae bacterium]|nr:fumarylacetoacetate hydrolase family protein [Dongiaceae bacterium]